MELGAISWAVDEYNRPIAAHFCFSVDIGSRQYKTAPVRYSFSSSSSREHRWLRIKPPTVNSAGACAYAPRTFCLWCCVLLQVKRLSEHTAIVNSCCPLQRGPPLFVSGGDDCKVKVGGRHSRQQPLQQTDQCRALQQSCCTQHSAAKCMRSFVFSTYGSLHGSCLALLCRSPAAAVANVAPGRWYIRCVCARVCHVCCPPFVATKRSCASNSGQHNAWGEAI